MKKTANPDISIIRHVISGILLLTILSITGIYILNHLEEIRSALHVSPINLALLSLLDIFFITLNGFRVRVLTKVFDIHLRPSEWLGLAATNSLLNYLPAQGGTVVRGIYLHKVHNLPLPAFAASVAASYIITFISLGTVGLIAILGAFLTQKPVDVELVGVMAASVAFGLLMAYFGRSIKFQARGSIPKRLIQVWDGWSIICNRHQTIRQLALLDLLGGITYACRLLIGFQMVSVRITFWQALMMTPLALLSIIVSLTPGALGVREAFVGWEAAILGLSVGYGIQAAAIERLSSLFWMAILSGIFGVRLPGLLGHFPEQNQPTFSRGNLK